jgi:hypothetical protein
MAPWDQLQIDANIDTSLLRGTWQWYQKGVSLEKQAGL